MANRTSPTVRRRRLAAELRELRKASGHSREAVASHIGVAPSTITRIENADSTAPPPTVAAMLDFYGVTGEEKEIWVTVAKQARRRGWWSQYGDTIPDWFKFYVGLEEEASEIRSYQPEVVFGLLQTKGYMRAIMQSEVEPLSEGELERRVEVRLKRQERLAGQDAPKMWIVLNESAIRREIGGRPVMSEQLLHLAELSQPGRLMLQVLPFTAGAHPALDGAFTVLGFPEPRDRDVVYVQSRRGGLYLEDPSDLTEYTEIFNHLMAKALSPEESREMILRITAEMT
ncbi:XRE family transcriptional regulator [Actinomadura craniellae]|uniref:XRE family transcriptional regulator n=1 Tax=Actinomadura craniellae TaxID=2231787 RepID=A0A365GV20_9ACTN|nr:helix-turn-helix transcriptional regulator [Actinomadura craniellae]RAY10639.1 XRE family transcriptional regulator [Actinomadura craniellae]